MQWLHTVQMSVCFADRIRSSPSRHQQQETLDNMPSDDDEHRLIARYTARLAADANNAVSCLRWLVFSVEFLLM